MILEVIATSVLDAKLAQEYGADRIELISGIVEGGVTPSVGLIEQVVKAVDIPVNVMLRPHANSFRYDEDDLAVMQRDARVIRESGAAGIVMGMLDERGEIDTAALELLLGETGELAVTFHRAFDELADRRAALELLSRYPAIRKILTSGGKPSALDAKEEIAELARLSEGRSLDILAGSGLGLVSLDEFIRLTGVREVHMGTGVRRNGRALEPIDPDKLRAAAEIVRRYK
ncbi:copper homeostasis protein [Cohnella sp. CIP 111063]|uniref:copper homeostasis protein CutC n=1 Tax=unclassified Cohnella TaxID=2636738 RepID=UPI000B8BED49|nr:MULTISPECIES: copper homeostasis protein CutC [unclassified Cohnella]OXS55588.1 copper homeostasis protein [Cohnella sp. CIP 111063]PRX66433.1 copper homeostasis protein [Cohnella sp. SGD-V74]